MVEAAVANEVRGLEKKHREVVRPVQRRWSKTWHTTKKSTREGGDGEQEVSWVDLVSLELNGID